MRQHVIVIQNRKASNKHERVTLGRTEISKNTHIVNIFLNKAQGQGEFVNSYFHELAHAFHHIVGGFQGTAKEEERIAQLVGDVVEPLYRKYTYKPHK